MNKKIETTVALALLAVGLIASIQIQHLKAQVGGGGQHCNADFTNCSAGQGFHDGISDNQGGSGGHFATDPLTGSHTISGGGGIHSSQVTGGGGGRTTCDSMGNCERVGGGIGRMSR